MSEWKDYKLGDVVTFQRGFDITKKEQSIGEFLVFLLPEFKAIIRNGKLMVQAW